MTQNVVGAFASVIFILLYTALSYPPSGLRSFIDAIRGAFKNDRQPS